MINDIPILILGYNRLDYLKLNIKNLSLFKPKYIFISIDGPKSTNERKEQADFKSVIIDLIDWDIHRIDFNFNLKNLGCRNGVIKGISDFFSIYDFGIILEDDVILKKDFLKYVISHKHLLGKKIGHISAYAPWSNKNSKNKDYLKTLRSFCWGWATNSKIWFKFIDSEIMTKDFRSKLPFFDIVRKIELTLDTYNNSWAIRWNTFLRSNYDFSIAPYQSMSKNIGIGDYRATHTKKKTTGILSANILQRSDFFFELSRILRVFIIILKK